MKNVVNMSMLVYLLNNVKDGVYTTVGGNVANNHGSPTCSWVSINISEANIELCILMFLLYNVLWFDCGVGSACVTPVQVAPKLFHVFVVYIIAFQNIPTFIKISK